jgi:anti-sigma regulatory factor (Ser/Thr protein kinase)
MSSGGGQLSPGTALENFPAAASSVPEARHFVRSIAEEHGGSIVGEPAELLASELVTNAVRHGQKSVQVGVHLDGRRLRVEVYDDAKDFPMMEQESLWSDHGRGLLLVAAISDHWGVEPVREGKRVWFELQTDPSSV